jgi:electron transfer flavoprotein beta subunit
MTPATFQPVINGFDENALEAALRLKDSHGATITVVSVGGQFALDIMKKALGMGADNLILCQDPLFAHLSDSFVTAQVLRAVARSRWNSSCPMGMWWLKRPCQRW